MVGRGFGADKRLSAPAAVSNVAGLDDKDSGGPCRARTIPFAGETA
jgi:hypothetical protein